MPRRAARASLLLVLLHGCTDPVAMTSDSSTGDASSTSSGTGSTTGEPTTGGSSTTGSTGFDPPTPTCGNGYIEGDEECDDGNAVDDDGCSNACTVPCGLSRQIVALAPSIESELWAESVAAAPDGDFVVVARQREITSDQEGNQTIGPVRTRVLRYTADTRLSWDVLLDPADADLVPTAGVIDDAGDVYVAASITGVDKEDILVTKLAGDGQSVLWTITHDGALAGSSDFARGLALAPDGDLVVAGRARDVDKDDDVWVRKLSADDGAEIWTSTWTGGGNGEFSTDDAGSVAVAPDGSVHVGASEYFAFNRSEAVLLRFGADGGKAQAVFSPLSDGQAHTHGPGFVSVDAAGDLLFSVTRLDGSLARFWIYRLTPDFDIVWERGLEDFEVDGDQLGLGGVRFAGSGDVAVTGAFRAADKMAQLYWYEAFVTRLDADGQKRCQIRYRAPSPDIIPPSIFTYDTAMDTGDQALVAGQLVVEGEQQLWIGLFRP